MLNDKICAATLDGSLTNYKNYLAGYYRGFYIAVIPRGQFIYVTVNAESPLDPNNDRLRSTVAQEASGNKWLNQASSVGAYKVLLVILAPGFASGLPKRVNAIVEPFVNDLAANGYVSGCGVCGRTDVTPELFDVNGMPAYYCPDCIERTRQHLEEGREAAQSVNSNLAIGMIGALIGTLVGVAASSSPATIRAEIIIIFFNLSMSSPPPSIHLLRFSFRSDREEDEGICNLRI